MQNKRILRSRSDRMIAGVAGGLGAYFGIDPIFVRLGFLVLAFLNGFGLFLYAVLWLLVPNEGTATSDSREQVREGFEEMRQTAEDAVHRVRSLFNG